MNKVGIVKAVVKGYFLAALAGSFTHVINAANKLGLEGWEAAITPFLIDGMFVIAMVMRSEEFSTRTRRIGFRVFIVMGLLSLSANIYAASHVGGIFLAVLLVGGMVFGEWLAMQIESAAVEEAHKAIADAEAKKLAAIAKGKATRARNARTKKAQTKALENLLK